MPHLHDTFIRHHTTIATSSFVPEVQLHLATEVTPLWLATEATLQKVEVEPPFWAFAWPGSLALARYILDNSDFVKGRKVMDFASGCGLGAIACRLAGAREVTTVDIDPLAIRASILNAELNGVTIQTLEADIIGTQPDADILICGDICYERALARKVFAWLRDLASQMIVILADPARHYAPSDGLLARCVYSVPVSRELEDCTRRETTIFQVLPEEKSARRDAAETSLLEGA